jgi:hypothetical protein
MTTKIKKKPTKKTEPSLAEKRLTIHQILNIPDKMERQKQIHEYLKENVIPSNVCKANALNDAVVIFNGGLF